MAAEERIVHLMEIREHEETCNQKWRRPLPGGMKNSGPGVSVDCESCGHQNTKSSLDHISLMTSIVLKPILRVLRTLC